MGTRGVWGFVSNGTERLTYNHFDSYPSGLGEDLLAWAKEQDWDKVRERVANLTIVDENEQPTDEERAKVAEFSDSGVSTGTDWYSALRHCQGNPEATLASGYMIDSHTFPLDSLFCEWGYVFDLDAGTLDVYRGFNKALPTTGRWAGRPTPEEDNDAYAAHVEWCKENGREPWFPQESTYKAIRMVAAFPLHDLPAPDLFLAECNEETEHL